MNDSNAITVILINQYLIMDILKEIVKDKKINRHISERLCVMDELLEIRKLKKEPAQD